MKNTGSDTPAVATTRQAWSMIEPGRVAARMPSGTAISIETMRPSSVSSADAGRRVCDLGRDRLAGGERGAEIAAREIGDVAAELDDQRLVEAELHADLLDRLLGGGGAGEIGGRVARQRPRQQEGDDHHADQARHGEQEALEHQHHGRPHVIGPAWPAIHVCSGKTWMPAGRA